MTNNADITIFNQALGEDRREVLIPTNIYGVCWYEVQSLHRNEKSRSGSTRVVIRIPYRAKIQDGRIYLPEEQYKRLSAEKRLQYWTIQKNAYIVKNPLEVAGKWKWDTFSFRSSVITQKEIEDILELTKIDGNFVTVVEYADNTVRGSNKVKHLRIGGE